MAITRPCYCNRDEVMRSTDSKAGLLSVDRVDRALASSADSIEGALHRVFYPRDTTYRFDWPNYQYTYPWQLYLDNWDLQVLTTLESPQGTTIPLNEAIPYPLNRKPGWPPRRIQLDRSTSAAWGSASSPQAAIWATGTWGFSDGMDAAGTITADIDDTVTTVPVSDGSLAGAGDVLILDPGTGVVPFPQTQYAHTFGAFAPLTGERVIVQDKTAADTGLTQDTGCTTASAADASLTWTGSGAVNTGEVLVLDAERMLVTDVVSSTAIVQRGWDGTVLAAHSGAGIYALRSLTVLRGQLGTTAASHSADVAVSRHRAPDLIRDLSLAVAMDQVLQETAGYSRTVSTGDAAVPAPGFALTQKWNAALTAYGRQARSRVV